MGLARSWCRFSKIAGHGGLKRVAGNRVELTEEQIQLIAKALADPRRHGACCGRLEAVTSRWSAPTFADCQPVSAATLSHHMKELEMAGLIRVTREGKFASYTLRRDVLKAYTEQLAKI